MRKLLTRSLAVLAMLALAGPARTDTFTEIGDAGQLPETAQLIGSFTPLPLDFIVGTLSSINDVDIYQIFIPNPAAFSATTVGQPGTLLDTQLFLFTAAGLGVEANDDAFLGTLRSSLPAGNPNAPTEPGIYLLAISSFNNDPVAPGGLDIFPNPSGIGETVGPTGPGGGLPFSGFTNSGFSTGTYQIALTGAEFVSVIPEPGTALLVGVGLLGMLGYGRRRLRRAG